MFMFDAVVLVLKNITRTFLLGSKPLNVLGTP